MDRRTLIAGVGCLTFPRVAVAADPVVTTDQGRVRGATGGGVHVFKGIPYGADTARHRFQPPRPAPPWQGIREANAFGPASPQTKPEEVAGEDCLSLNIWTPAADSTARLPVMVYFHGGEFSHGSGASPLTDGTHLARRGNVVVVTVNHRLAAFGHLFLAKLLGPEYASSGNVGLLDLVAALQWTRRNVAAFGGDPGCVTVFGQSGGGAKIATLMAMPAARGLFHRAATMSGQQVTASGPYAAHARTLAFLDALKLKPAEAAKVLTLPLETLVAAMEAADPTIPRNAIYFGPVLDGEALPRHPFFPDAPEQSNAIPMMIGNTLNETRAFFRSDRGIDSLTWDALPGRLMGELRVDIDTDHVVAAYRRLMPAASPTEVFYAATTASRSWRGALIEAEARAAAGAPVFMHQLNWRSPLDGGRWGAAHTLDIPLVFGTTSTPQAISSDGPEVRRISEIVADTYIAFARTGNPNHAGLPSWPRYTLERRATMVFDLPPRLEDDPRGDERRLFAPVPFIQKGTL